MTEEEKKPNAMGNLNKCLEQLTMSFSKFQKKQEHSSRPFTQNAFTMRPDNSENQMKDQASSLCACWMCGKTDIHKIGMMNCPIATKYLNEGII